YQYLTATRSPLTLFHYTSPAPASTYTLSLHDALPILERFTAATASELEANKCEVRAAGRIVSIRLMGKADRNDAAGGAHFALIGDRKSTRLNSSHVAISYAVFCLKKKKTKKEKKTSKY